MSTGAVIALVIAVVLVLVLVAVVVAATRRRRARESAERREVAGQLRQQAVSHTADVQQSELQVREAEAEAELARARAARADQEAATTRQAAAVDQARQEDVLREADRLDPDVDHRADDYRPGTDVLDDPLPAADPGVGPAAGSTGVRSTDLPDEPTSGTTGPTHRA